jgi:signal transduction histidine kinase
MAMRLTIRRKLFLAFLAVVAGPLAATVFMVRTFLEQKYENVERSWVEESRRQMIGLLEDIDRSHRVVADAVAQLGSELDADVNVFDAVTFDALSDGNEVGQFLGKKLKQKISREVFDSLREAGAAQLASKSLDPEELAENVDDLKKEHPSVRWVQISFGKTVLFKDPASALPSLNLEVAPTATAREGHVVKTGDDRVFAVSAKRGGPLVVAELDPAGDSRPRKAAPGWVFLIDDKGQLSHRAGRDLTELASYPLISIAQAKAVPGQLTRVRIPTTDEVYVVYAPATTKNNASANLRLVAAVPEHVLRAKLLILRAVLIAVVLMAVPMAAFLALWLSSRMVKAVTTVREGVDAVARGEQANVAIVSSDELGGALVQSVNRLASRVAEQKRREEIESWRRLVRVLSHEINNTLGPVRSVASTARDQILTRLPPGEEAEDLALALKLILDRTEALGAFIAGYAELAKLPEPRRAPVAANELVAAAVALSREAAAGREQRLIEEYDERVGTAWLDRAQVERVVINLVKNAVEAAPPRGMVRVETHWTPDGFELIVEDDGPGISPEARKQLFVPYFTTKPGGSGVGLALARQIVLMHGGAIVAEDRPGGGARMRVTLPREPVMVEAAA